MTATPGATVGSVEVWRSIVGHGAVGDADYVKRRVKPEHAGAALDAVSGYQGAATDVLVHTLREVVFRMAATCNTPVRCSGFTGVWGRACRMVTRPGLAIPRSVEVAL